MGVIIDGFRTFMRSLSHPSMKSLTAEQNFSLLFYEIQLFSFEVKNKLFLGKHSMIKRTCQQSYVSISKAERFYLDKENILHTFLPRKTFIRSLHLSVAYHLKSGNELFLNVTRISSLIKCWERSALDHRTYMPHSMQDCMS